MAYIRRAYRKPPIEQVVCEFKFDLSRDWDLTIPGILYEQIKKEFPIKKQTHSLELNVSPGSAGIGLVQEFKGAVSSMQFLSADSTEMVQVGADLISVHAISSYKNWDFFSARIREISTIYEEITAPKGITRVGLRYVNVVRIPSDTFELTDYFNYYPHLPQTIDQRHGPFLTGVLFFYNELRDHLNARVATVANGINLDLDYYLAKPNGIEIRELPKWIDEAHEKIETMFEACITDRSREMFEPAEEHA